MKSAFRLTVIGGLCLSFPCFSEAADQTFGQWEQQWTSSIRHDKIEAIEQLAPGAAFAELISNVENLKSQNVGAQWRATFLCNAKFLTSLNSALLNSDLLNEVRPGNPITQDLQTKVASEKERLKTVLREANANQFRPQPPTVDVSYRIFADNPHGCGEIAIPSTSTGTIDAKVIYTSADLIYQYIADGGTEELQQVAHAVQVSDAKWQQFFKNAVYDDLPWELYLNEVFKHFVPALRGTLSQPPSAQMRFLHPLPIMVVSTERKTTFKENFGIEMIGWRVFDPNSYEPRWGISALAALRQSTDESNGLGLLVTFKSWSVGAIARDTPGKKNQVQIVVGVDVAKWVQEKETDVDSAVERYKSVKDKLDQGWAGAKAAAEGPNGP